MNAHRDPADHPRPSTLPPRAPGPPPFAGRAPEELRVYQVCPHCKAVLETCSVRCDGHIFETYSCPVHGDVVVPVNSHVASPAPPPGGIARNYRKPFQL